jgi:hypothetical protein
VEVDMPTDPTVTTVPTMTNIPTTPATPSATKEQRNDPSRKTAATEVNSFQGVRGQDEDDLEGPREPEDE